MPREQRKGAQERRERLKGLLDGPNIPDWALNAKLPARWRKLPPVRSKAKPAPKPAPKPASSTEAKRKRGVNRKRNRLLPAGPLTLGDWYCTPREIFDALDREIGPFTLDAAATRENALVARYISEKQNGLKRKWRNADGSRAVVFVNPPYGLGLNLWIEKAVAATAHSSNEAETVAMLLPLYGDVKWFHHVMLPHVSDLIHIQGRLKFNSPALTGSRACPNASFVAVFRHRRPPLRTASMSNKGDSVVWHRAT
jgi:phage N-6-adenine-methyltransferase